MQDLNILAAIVAALAGFLIGGLWYSPLLFLKPWLAANESPEKQPGHPAVVYGLSFAFMLAGAVALSGWLGPDPGVTEGLARGAIAGFAFVACSFGVNYQFANRSMTLLLIDGGYHLVQFAAMGLILGAWPWS